MLIAVLCLPLKLFAQIHDDTNPTKPVFLSIREELYNLKQDRWINLFIFRSDKVILKKTAHITPKGVILRYDLPIATADTGTETVTGLGDLYTQALFFPHLGRTFTFAAGSGFILPTATDTLLGRGKWQIAPVAAPVWFFPRNRGFSFVKFQDFISVAGNGSRPDVHYFLITPTLLWRFTKQSWISLDSESKTNWERENATSFRSGVQLGTMLNRNVGFWVKPEFPWGQHREGDWTLKFTLILAR